MITGELKTTPQREMAGWLCHPGLLIFLVPACLVVDVQNDTLCVCSCKDQLVFMKCGSNAQHTVSSQLLAVVVC